SWRPLRRKPWEGRPSPDPQARIPAVTGTEPCDGHGACGVAAAHCAQGLSVAAIQGDEVMTITVYSKPACVQCTATTRALDAKGLDYSIVGLTEEAAAMEKVTALGYRQAPVVIAGDAHWAGFRPDMIGRLA